MTPDEAARIATRYKAAIKKPEASPGWLALEAVSIAGHIAKRLAMLTDSEPNPVIIQQLKSYNEILITAAGLTLQAELDGKQNENR